MTKPETEKLLDAFVGELLDLIDWVGTGDRRSGDAFERDTRARWDDLRNSIRAQGGGEVERLRELVAVCYAGLGAECDLPEPWLDALSQAANGEPFSTDGLLPFKATPDAAPDAVTRERVFQKARFRAACYALLDRVDGWSGRGERWESGGLRLKDTPEWVTFHNAVVAMRDRGEPDPIAHARSAGGEGRE